MINSIIINSYKMIIFWIFKINSIKMIIINWIFKINSIKMIIKSKIINWILIQFNSIKVIINSIIINWIFKINSIKMIIN